ncbi:MAG: holo-ACP synthase [Planctomycetota bacterium]|jgi:holo-[acyl-carrier protein] synthase
MIISCGVDICETRRIARMREEHGDRFLQRTFTADELAYSLGRPRENEHLAGRFAAKEAVMKALGTGWSAGISWLDVSVSILPSGEPRVALLSRAAQVADERGITKLHISLSHCHSYAVAMAVAEGRD